MGNLRTYYSFFITFFVINFDKSIDVNKVQLLNISSISVAFSVENKTKCYFFKFEHPKYT